jgi:hypothetical protein
MNAAGNETMILGDQDDGVDLYFNNVKKFETTDTGASVTGVGKFFLENNGGAGGGIVASNTDASNPALGGFLDLMERDVNFGTANNYGVRLYYDGSTNKFHIQGGNETTVATHLTMVRDSGDITIDSGDLIFGTAGKGIVLGSTSNTDANTLSDYETGTWTPELSVKPSGVALGTVTVANYTKIGDRVLISLQCAITSSSVPAPNSDMRLIGFPFTNANSGVNMPAVFNYNYKETPQLHINGSGYLYFQSTTVGGNNQSPAGGGLDANTTLSLSIQYKTNS